MTMTDEALRQLYQSHKSDAPATERSGCLETEVLVALHGDELDTEARKRAVEHLLTCDHCAQELKLLGHLEEWGAQVARDVTALVAPSATPEVPKSLPTAGRWRPITWLAAAAVLTMAVAGGWFLSQGQRPSSPEIERGPGAIAVTPAADSILPKAPQFFEWPAMTSDRYRFRLFDAAGDLLLERQIEGGPELRLPEDELAGLEPGGSFMWVVETGSGSRTTRLGPFWFELQNEGE